MFKRFGITNPNLISPSHTRHVLRTLTQQGTTPVRLDNQQAIEVLSAAVYTCDAQGKVAFYNEAATALWGRTPEIGKDQWCGSWKIYRPDGSPLPLDQCPMATVMQHGTPIASAEIVIERPDHQRRHVLVHPKALFDAEGNLTGAVNMLIDITNSKHADVLTGLPNRTLLADRCSHAISSAYRDSKPLAMMVLGIDRFKVINDTLGHAVGDEVLKQFALRVKVALRDQDTVARVGSDEFALILPGNTPEGAAHLASKLTDLVAQLYRVSGVELNLTTSIGIAMYPSDGQAFEALFKSAEVALHQAKEFSRGKHRFFSAEIFESTMAQAAMVVGLRTAITHNQLQLHYQPFVDMQTGKIGGMEGLLRWNHPELGAVPPSKFIPVAEQSGLIGQIGKWVFRCACQDIRTWLDQGVQVPLVSVNVSPVQFRDAALLLDMSNTLHEFDIEPHRICIEVTEGALMEDVAHSETQLRALKTLGVKLALDDFGTGYSSLSYLKLFPFDKVKIDQSFVRDISTRSQDAVIAKVVISMAHGLGLRVIAEGVETEVQCEFMRSNVCDEIQGYFYSRPVPKDQMRDLLVADRRLPSHLMRVHTKVRTVLLVDDEPNVIAALRRLLRRDGYQILSASNGLEGLALLTKTPVDIIVSDQRMPGMTGVEFLRQAKMLYPDTVRIVLSGYTELQSVTDAINEGAIYRFLTKPWDDTLLRSLIVEAFHHKELADENQQLNLKIRTANQELATSNRQLQEVLSHTQAQITRGEVSLNVACKALQCIPIPVLGLDDAGLLTFASEQAQGLFTDARGLLGSALATRLPALAAQIKLTPEGEFGLITLASQTYQVQWRHIRECATTTTNNRIVTLIQERHLEAYPLSTEKP